MSAIEPLPAVAAAPHVESTVDSRRAPRQRPTLSRGRGAPADIDLPRDTAWMRFGGSSTKHVDGVADGRPGRRVLF